jgi:hypothetical protein
MTGSSSEAILSPWPAIRGYKLRSVYQYCDESGRTVKESARYQADPGAPEAKTFRQRWPKPGACRMAVYKRPDGMRDVLYRLPEIIQCAEGGEGDLWWVEGEKDAEAARAIGLTATTVGGVSAPLPVDLDVQLRGIRRLLILPDNDEPGRIHAEKVAAVVSAIGIESRLVVLPRLPDHGDLSDFLAAGGTEDDLWRLAEAEEAWKPLPSPDPIPIKPDTGTGRSVADELYRFVLELVDAGAIELFCDEGGSAFATVRPPVSPAVRTFDVDDRDFERVILNAVRSDRGKRGSRPKVPSSAVWKDVVRSVSAVASEERPRAVHYRIARIGPEVFIDLGDTTGRAIVVSTDGWRVADDALPARFRRSRTMQALPVPERAGDGPDRFWSYLHATDSCRPLMLAWAVAALAGKGPFPVLTIHGEQGSAKTNTARFLRGLIDPAKAALRGLSHDERDLMVCAHNNYVLGFDNLSGIEPRMSDALCRLASGEGFGIRALYTNRDEEVFDGARPILLTGIDEAAGRPDLLDRSYLVEAPRIAASERRDEAQLRAEFDQDRPALLATLLDALVAGLAGARNVHLASQPRMLDAARIAVAAEPALGLAPGTMAAAIDAAKQSASDAALGASPFAQAILAFMETRDRPWLGSLSTLLDELQAANEDGWRRPRSWPATPRAASSHLQRTAPGLRDAGLSVVKLGPQGKRRERKWQLEWVEPAESER